MQWLRYLKIFPGRERHAYLHTLETMVNDDLAILLSLSRVSLSSVTEQLTHGQ